MAQPTQQSCTTQLPVASWDALLRESRAARQHLLLVRDTTGTTTGTTCTDGNGNSNGTAEVEDAWRTNGLMTFVRTTAPVIAEQLILGSPHDDDPRASRHQQQTVEQRKHKHKHNALVTTTHITVTTHITITTATKRQVLRLALSCVSVPAEYPELRRIVQDETFALWCDGLLQTIVGINNANNNKSANDDAAATAETCRQLAARVLCNCVTQNSRTASVLLERVPVAPSEFWITTAAQQQQLGRRTTAPPHLDANHQHDDHQHDDHQHDDDGPSSTTTRALENTVRLSEAAAAANTTTTRPSWVELLLACAAGQNRTALAAVVAGLHNALWAIRGVDDPSSSAAAETHRRRVASSALLVATLLRQMLPARAAGPPPEEDGAATTDDATEWISRLVAHLCTRGHLPLLYRSLASGAATGPVVVVVPEQVVLLHAVLRQVRDDTAADYPGNDAATAIGHDPTTAVATHIFLATLYCRCGNAPPTRDRKEEDDDDRGLREAVQQLVLDILAETLAHDNAVTRSIREAVGTETTLVPQLVRDLGAILDDRAQRLAAASMSPAAQRRVVAVVRGLGNLCHGNRHNQDSLRTTTLSRHRNGLHVLLSSTTLAFQCFTLREWAVVALRGALEDNPANQQVVADLEAQEAVQSAELRDMGLRVDLRHDDTNHHHHNNQNSKGSHVLVTPWNEDAVGENGDGDAI